MVVPLGSIFTAKAWGSSRKRVTGATLRLNLVIFHHLPGWNGRQRRLMEAPESQAGGHCDRRSLTD